MKKPNAEQLQQLKLLRQYNKVTEYLDIVEDEYVTRLVQEEDVVKVRQLQGSLYVLQELKKHIHTEAR